MPQVAIIDYGSGNLRSAAKAFQRALGGKGGVAVTAEAAALARATHIVLPGVGAFADCLRGVTALPGMVDALRREALEGGKPFLGICVGMQLLADRGLEHGDHAGLGWIAGEVRRLEPRDPTLKVPHMGWNEVATAAPHPLFEGLSSAHFYFVHSYHFVPKVAAEQLAAADYGGDIAAAVGRDNLVGTQFHPEKSQTAGLRLLANFLRWRP
ncbi:MAG: imidazole glycerol phosphate synthase subunit HisH [Rhodospirillaceae bacterium]|nr:imidazole glycerol phosphate synthase subunit HisH [Rhodospirillaceae bacterium]